MSELPPLYDRDTLRRVEAQATQALGGEDVLMQRAGLAAWREVLAHWSQAVRIVVVCGPGNNGGDGWVLARHAHAAGRDVRVVHLPTHAPRTALAQRMQQEFLEVGGRSEEFAGGFGDVDLIIDALFGIGLSRAPDDDAQAMIRAINDTGTPVFALDVPSGVDADSGAVPGAAVHATHTLQFIAAHVGLATGAALEYGGDCSVASLDVAPALLATSQPAAHLWTMEALAKCLQPRRRNTHKGESGRVLCIGGDHGKGGAIALCAESALRSGAGLVDVATRAAHVSALLARRPEVMAHATEDAADLHALYDAADVVALGPGLGQDAWGRALYAAAIDARRPLVIDADALNLLAASSTHALRPDAVLTPHPGEAARLLGIGTHDVQRDRPAAVRALCERYGCIVVLKGAGTLVAAPGESTRVIAAGNPGMAVGGMGDVLTGVIAALRAQDLAAFDAASCGALLHALAGDAAARDGERGLLPSDLFAHLRRLANP